MKKFFIFITFLFVFFIPSSVFAAADVGGSGGAAVKCTPSGPNPPECIFGTITAPTSIQSLVNQGGAGGVSTVLKNFIILFYQIAIILFVFMVIFSALQWITSGGDKEKVANARGRLTNAVIGFILLGLVWLITNVLGVVTGIKLPFS